MPKDQMCAHSATVMGRVLNTGHFKQRHQNLRATNQLYGGTGHFQQRHQNLRATNQYYGGTGHFN